MGSASASPSLSYAFVIARFFPVCHCIFHTDEDDGDINDLGERSKQTES